jgi:omega-amidase
VSAVVGQPTESGTLRVALGEYDTGWHDPEGSLARAESVVSAAAAAGAELVVLPEMCTTGFTMEAAAHAEPLDGPSVGRLAGIAARHGVRLLAGVATHEPERAGAVPYFNSALLFDGDGALVAHYRKQRLFGFAREDAAYAAGDAPAIATLGGVRLALFICYDLRFPELFRAVSPEVDGIVLLANWPAARRAHWDVLVRARAIENQCFVVAVNRVGEGGGIAYDGGSVIYDPWGDRIDEPAAAGQGPRSATIDPGVVAAIRTRFPFLEDRRPAHR